MAHRYKCNTRNYWGVCAYMGQSREGYNGEKKKKMIPYICILILNIANCRYKRLNYGRYDLHDLFCIVLALIGVCVTLS